MNTALLAAMMLLCGIPFGFILGLVIGVKMFGRVDRLDDFDGGYKYQNHPPVRTTIFSDTVKNGDEP
jgi:hypothetical protein